MTGTDVMILLDHFGTGGVERVACHVANALTRKGLRVEMVVLDTRGPVRALLDAEVRQTCLGGIRALPRGLRLCAAIPALARHIARARPAVVHSPGNHTHVASALALALSGARAAFVPKITNPLFKRGSGAAQRWVRRRFYASVFAGSQAIIALSEASAREIRDIAPPGVGDRVRLVHNPYVQLAPRDEAHPVPRAKPPVILSVGRLSRQKDQGTLLRAAALLKDRDWQLRLFGEGPDRSALELLAAELGIADRVMFGGYVSDLTSEYAEAGVFALSSRWEELPAVLFEALAQGCPVVTTASSPAIAAMLKDIGGQAPVPVGDVTALARAMAAVLDGTVSAVSPEMLRPYDIDTAGEEHARLFAALVSR